jgi:AraC-like DNA-binding protein
MRTPVEAGAMGSRSRDPRATTKPISDAAHLSHEEQVKVVTMYQAGKTINAVAREFKLHRTTVTAILDRHDVPVRPHYMTQSHVDQARVLYESGSSLARIGDRLGFDAQTVRTHLFRAGVQIRGAHERRSAS